MRRALLQTVLLAALSVRCSLLYPIDDLRDGAAEAVGGLRTAVVVVRSPGRGLPSPDPQNVREAVFMETSSFLQEASYGRAWLEGDVLGPIDVALPAVPCAREAVAAAAADGLRRSGYDLEGYRPILYLHADLDCPAPLAWDAEAGRGWLRTGLPDAAWGHLLGHLLGLGHAGTLDCGAATLQPIGACASNDTNDVFDVMGAGTEEPPSEGYAWGHPSARAKEKLGWFGDGRGIQEISEDGDYALEALETPSTGDKALHVARPLAGDAQHFELELRVSIGFDTTDANAGDRRTGVVIHLVSGGASMLLDSTPESAVGQSDWSDAAWIAGDTFVDHESGLSIGVGSIEGTRAEVEVRYGTADPTWSAAPVSEAVRAWPTTVHSRGLINVDFDASNTRTASDWIGLYALDGQGGASPIWIGATRGRSSGRLLAQAPDRAGTYEFRYYRGLGETERVVNSNPIRISR